MKSHDRKSRDKMRGSENITTTVVKGKLNYRIHNPNAVNDTINYLLKVFIEANSEKVEKAIQSAIKTDSYQINSP